MKLGVVGAGINGIMCAWALLEDGHDVVVFERDEPVCATSSASTKLLHGGLRYLEHGDFGLVREGLRAREWWLRQAPQHTRQVEIAIPVFAGARRARWKVKAGLFLYESLAGRRRLGRHHWLDARALAVRVPELKTSGLRGAYVFQDGQMDDQALGLWAMARIVDLGATVRAHCPVERIDADGGIVTSAGRERFDGIVNACGPWSEALLRRSGIPSSCSLDLVRGSHLLYARRHACGFLVESPDDGRACFILPYGEHSLIGTTEVRQSLDDPAVCSPAERAYLSNLYDAYFEPGLDVSRVVSTFAGIRPLLASPTSDVSRLSRESEIACQGRVVTVFGGKWTTSRELGLRVAGAVRRQLRSGAA